MPAGRPLLRSSIQMSSRATGGRNHHHDGGGQQFWESPLNGGPQQRRTPTPALSRFLLQRAVQTQCCYLTEFHDEVRSSWLAAFNEPAAPLAAEALSDRECRPAYHGLDAFCDDVTTIDYLGAMLTSEPITYQVRYLVGSVPYGHYGGATSGGQYDGFAETASKGLEMWGEHPAAASRRRNPYLQSSRKYVEYDEELVPSKLARQVMSTRAHLAAEVAMDLVALANRALEDEYEYGLYGAASPDELLATRGSLPLTKDDGDSSPLRRETVDLIDRLVTREAAILAARELPAAASRWIRERLEPDDPVDDGTTASASRNAAASSAKDARAVLEDGNDADFFADLRAAVCRLSTRDALGDHSRADMLAAKWLARLASEPAFRATASGKRVDPRAAAKRINKHRVELFVEWAKDLAPEVDVEHLDVFLREKANTASAAAAEARGGGSRGVEGAHYLAKSSSSKFGAGRAPRERKNRRGRRASDDDGFFYL